jgi:hypothetical protein
LYIGFKELLSFGSWAGSNENPPLKFIPSPNAGLYYAGKYISCRMGINWYEFPHNFPSPLHVEVGMALHFPFKEAAYTPPNVDWIGQ